mmetsp:Transcript_26291/g.35907  ORF Transcript_26291/g.35907 Transcript_26291/m.35907 type:complete len:320 (+) Transcript_26291:600-1559(+)
MSPTKARTAEQMAMPAADHIRRAQRPFLSTRKIAGKVLRMFTTPDTAVKRRPACEDLKIISKILGPSYIKALRPHICWIICKETPIMRSFSMSPEKNSDQRGLPDALSCSRSRRICANSMRTSSSSLRTAMSVFRASLNLFLDTSQRGERGMMMPPMARKPPGISWPRMTQRHPPIGFSTFSNSSAIRNATMIPTVTASWYTATSMPRCDGGAISLWYTGTFAERMPTDMPAMKRPIIITVISIARPCISAPTQNTMPPAITEPFRPKVSTTQLMMGGNAATAAPTPKIIVIQLSSESVIFRPPSTSFSKDTMDLTPAM